MLHEFLGFSRWLWYAVLLPYVLIAMANLVADGVEALSHIGQTLHVMLCFVCGRSHRPYPVRRAQLEKLKVCAIADFRATGGALHAGDTDDCAPDSHSTVAVSPAGGETSAEKSSGGSATDEVNGTTALVRRGTAETSAAVAASSSSSPTSPSPSLLALLRHRLEAVWDVVIERRLLRGRKGEILEWLPPVVGRFLIAPNFPLSYDKGLHLLVGSFIGPIQQPTVSTLPSRHLTPQWPPHYGARHVPSSANALSLRPDASTDDNSSATDVRARAEGRHASSFSGPRAAAANATARPKFRQVYRRESAKNIDLQSRHAPAHLIASITSNHVLSYQGTRQKVLVIDLDETLCHVSTTTADMLGPPTFSEVIPTLAGSELFHVWERPNVRLFLATAAQLFNLVLFTSASKPYADTILRRIDPHHYIQERYYRQDCRLITRGIMARHLLAEKQKRQLAHAATSTGLSEAERTTDGELRQTSGAVSDASTSGPLAKTSRVMPTPPALQRGTAAATPVPPFMEERLRRRLVSRTDDTTPAAADAEAHVELTPDKGGDLSSHGVAEAAGRERVADGLRSTPKPVFNENAKVLVKDLRVLKVPPELCVMLDNSEECTLLNRENALVIQPYIPSAEAQKQARLAAEEGFPAVDPDEDEVLLGVLAFLECLLVVPDVRSVLRHGKVC